MHNIWALHVAIGGAGSVNERKVYVACDPADAMEANGLLRHQRTLEIVSFGADPENYMGVEDEALILRGLRARTLQDSTVTIVVVGRCTHSLRSVDWEIKASLFHERGQAPNGLVALALPGAGRYEDLPPRLLANVGEDNSRYAAFWTFTRDAAAWDRVIEEAFVARVSRVEAIRNTDPLMRANARCRSCGVVHDR